MITRAQFAELALAMPEAEQAAHFGNPDFRVRNKIFATLDRDGERGSLKVRAEIQGLLVEARPDVFVPAAGAWGASGWTYVMLERVELDEMRELIADAWRLIAPARLGAEHPGSGAPALELEVAPLLPGQASGRRNPARGTNGAGIEKKKKKTLKRRSPRA